MMAYDYVVSQDPHLYEPRKGNSGPHDPSCIEALRLASFSVGWPNNANNAFPTQLAKAGFFWDTQRRQVACFSCGGTLNNEDLSKPGEMHQMKYPHCSFVRGLDSRNIPISDASSLFMEGNSSKSSPNDSPFNSLTSDTRYSPMQGGSPSGNMFQQRNMFEQNEVGIHSINYLSHRDHGDSDPNANRGGPRSLPASLEQAHKMKHELNRRASFQTWPAGCPVTPTECARAGFFFIGPEDRVKCAFCSGVLCNWAPGDTAVGEHLRYFPKCPFNLNPTGVGNVPIEATVRETSVFGGASVLAPELQGLSLSNREDLSGLQYEAAHPDMVSPAARLRSYDLWPRTMRQTPQQMADAGFIYTGLRDNVKCFFCDGGLRNWEETDDPCTEHARWFPRCQFIVKVKGQGFVDAVAARYPQQQAMPEMEPMEPSGGKQPLMPSPTPGGTSAPTGAGSNSFNIPGLTINETRMMKARIDTPTVRAVLEMGFSKRQVGQAIINRLRATNDDFPNPPALLEAVLEMNVEHPEFRDDEAYDQDRTHSGSETTPIPSPNPPQQPAASAPEPSMPGEEDMQSIIDEHRRLKEERTCKICMDELSNVVFLPCGHLCACATCAPALRMCPMCRSTIRGTVKTFIS